MITDAQCKCVFSYELLSTVIAHFLHVLHLEYYANVMEMLSRQFQLLACGYDFLKDEYCGTAAFCDIP